jgi:hypothetical protein
MQYSGEWEHVLKISQIRERHKFRPGKHPQADWVQISTDGAYVSELGNGGCGLLAKTTMETWCLLLVAVSGWGGQMEVDFDV